MRYLFCKKSISPRVREHNKTLLVGKSCRDHTRASGLRYRRTVRDFHGNRNPPGSENPQRVVADGEDFGVYAPVHPTGLCFSFLPSSLPLIPAVDQCVDGFHFRGVKVLHHRKLKSPHCREKWIAIRSMTFSVLAII